MIDVLIPTVGRADRLAALAANIYDCTTVDHRVVFIIEQDDRETRRATAELAAAGHACPVLNRNARNYAGAIQSGYERELFPAPFLFAGADDVRFQPGWAEACLAEMAGPVRVVGTNDLCNPYVHQGIHATHYLVDRRYLDEVGGLVDGGPGSFLYPYDHQYTDSEFIGTARDRGVFAPCLASIVEHLHWSTGKSDADETTVKANARIGEDEVLFWSRRHLWGFHDCHEFDPT